MPHPTTRCRKMPDGSPLVPEGMCAYCLLWPELLKYPWGAYDELPDVEKVPEGIICRTKRGYVAARNGSWLRL